MDECTTNTHNCDNNANQEALKVAKNLYYTKLPTEESSMESGQSDTEMLYHEVLKEKRAIIEGRRKNLSSYEDLSSDDDWFLASVASITIYYVPWGISYHSHF